jgi:general secretion pathway protein L
MPNLNSAIELDYKKFFRWWKRELSFLVPQNVKELVSDQHGIIIVRPQGDILALSYWLDDHEQPLISLERDENGIAKYRKLLAEDERLQKADLVLRLSKKFALQKELALPAAAKENLNQVVAYELSRYSPFMADQAYFAVKPLDTANNEPGQIRVMLIVTAHNVLDGLLADVKSLGMSPKIVDYEDFPNDLSDYSSHYNLLPLELRGKNDLTTQIVHYSLMGLAGLLFIAVLVFPVWLESRAIDALQAKTDVIEKEAKSIKALQAKLDSSIDNTKQLIDRKTEKPMVIEVLDTLSQLIKDDTWLAYAQYTNGQLQIQGESPAASTLISVLEASDYFVNAKFVSPVTRDNVTKLERFQISVDVTKVGENNGSGKK